MKYEMNVSGYVKVEVIRRSVDSRKVVLAL